MWPYDVIRHGSRLSAALDFRKSNAPVVGPPVFTNDRNSRKHSEISDHGGTITEKLDAKQQTYGYTVSSLGFELKLW